MERGRGRKRSFVNLLVAQSMRRDGAIFNSIGLEWLIATKNTTAVAVNMGDTTIVITPFAWMKASLVGRDVN